MTNDETKMLDTGDDTSSDDSQTDDNQAVSDDQVTEDSGDEQNQENTDEQSDTPADANPEELKEDAEEEQSEPVNDEATDSDSAEEKKEEVKADPAADQNKVRIITKALKNIERDIANVIRLLDSEASPVSSNVPQVMNTAGNVTPAALDSSPDLQGDTDGRVVEGVFDGQNMVGSDGKIYTVPANYASKSKLVEGDMLKLTITPRGSFIYKQIGPIERVRVMATLGFDPTIGEYYAADETRRWSILKASVTYYRGDVSDEVVLLVPKNAPSKWAAVENIIKNNPLEGNTETFQSAPAMPITDANISTDPIPAPATEETPPAAEEPPVSVEDTEDKPAEEILSIT